MDWDHPPAVIAQGVDLALRGWDLAKGWLSSPAAWSQFALIIAAYLLAFLLARKFRPALARLLAPPPDRTISLPGSARPCCCSCP